VVHYVPAWSNTPLLGELAWSGELLNDAPTWSFCLRELAV